MKKSSGSVQLASIRQPIFAAVQKASDVEKGNKQLYEALVTLIDLLRKGDIDALKHKEIEENQKLLEHLKETRRGFTEVSRNLD